MSKGNIRSIRISDDMAELIDRQVGNNFTEKWENLVTRCVWELPKKEQELERIQQNIDRERQKLRDLKKAQQNLEDLEESLQYAQHYLDKVEHMAKSV